MRGRMCRIGESSFETSAWLLWPRVQVEVLRGYRWVWGEVCSERGTRLRRPRTPLRKLRELRFQRELAWGELITHIAMVIHAQNVDNANRLVFRSCTGKRSPARPSGFCLSLGQSGPSDHPHRSRWWSWGQHTRYRPLHGGHPSHSSTFPPFCGSSLCLQSPA